MNLKYQLVFQLKKLYWFVVRPKTQGVKCVLVNDGRVLMVRRRFGTDKWVFPGGAIQTGESTEVAIRREIKEDVGVDLAAIQDIGSFAQKVHHRSETLHCFSAQVGTEVKSFDNQKIQEVRWFPVGKLPYLTPVSKSVMNQYRYEHQ